jgi:hypothetical protein
MGTVMSGGIFISYRRDDAKHAAGRLMDRLEKNYRREQLFIDVDGIEPGLNFVRALSEKVEACDVLLAIIGPEWLDARDETGQRRLDNPNDFVRIEIEAALKRDVRVVPVLVDGAPMPREQQLPDALKELSQRQAVRLAHERFGADADGLVTALEKVIAPWPKQGDWIGRLTNRAGRAGAPAHQKPDQRRREASTAETANQRTGAEIADPATARPAAGPQTSGEGAAARQPLQDKWPILLAALFPVLVSAILIGAGNLVSDENTLAATSFAMFVCAVPLASKRHGLERSLYWLGGAIGLVLAIAIVFPWAWLPPSGLRENGNHGDKILTGVVTGSVLTVLSASFLTTGKRTRLGIRETLVYWLGSVVSVPFAVSAFIGTSNIAWKKEFMLMGPLLVAILISLFAYIIYAHKRKLAQ